MIGQYADGVTTRKAEPAGDQFGGLKHVILPTTSVGAVAVDKVLGIYGTKRVISGDLRGLVIAAQAKSTFTRLLAASITLTFFTYAFVNMGMVSGCQYQ